MEINLSVHNNILALFFFFQIVKSFQVKPSKPKLKLPLLLFLDPREKVKLFCLITGNSLRKQISVIERQEDYVSLLSF